jgi:hypothetical protein
LRARAGGEGNVGASIGDGWADKEVLELDCGRKGGKYTLFVEGYTPTITLVAPLASRKRQVITVQKQYQESGKDLVSIGNN